MGPIPEHSPRKYVSVWGGGSRGKKEKKRKPRRRLAGRGHAVTMISVSGLPRPILLALTSPRWAAYISQRLAGGWQQFHISLPTSQRQEIGLLWASGTVVAAAPGRTTGGAGIRQPLLVQISRRMLDDARLAFDRRCASSLCSVIGRSRPASSQILSRVSDMSVRLAHRIL